MTKVAASPSIGPDRPLLTDEMIRAGAEVLWRAYGDLIPYESSGALATASEVFEAMLCARKDPHAPSENKS